MREILEAIDNAHAKALCDAAAEHFGITYDPTECGYLLPDGRMLDLSGRHQMLGGDYVRTPNGTNAPKRGKDWQQGVRQTDHRELDELVVEGGTDGMLRFMERSGAIRVMPPIGFTLRTMPTKRQIATMCAMAKSFDDSPHIEVYNDDAIATASQEFPRMTPAAVIKFLQGVSF